MFTFQLAKKMPGGTVENVYPDDFNYIHLEANA